MAKEVVLKFRIDGATDSIASLVSIQKAIQKIKDDLASGISNEAFQQQKKALQELEAEYAKLVSTVEDSNSAIEDSADEMAGSVEESFDKASEGSKNFEKNAKDTAKNTSDSFTKTGDNIEKFAKGVVDAFVGVAIVLGSSKEDADKFAQKFAETIGVAHAIKGGIEAATSGFELLKTSFPGVISGLQKVWAVMVANPIGAIITSVAALGTAIYAVTKSLAGYTEEQKRAIEIEEALIEAHKRQTEELKKQTEQAAELNDEEARHNQNIIDLNKISIERTKIQRELEENGKGLVKSNDLQKLSNEELLQVYEKSVKKLEDLKRANVEARDLSYSLTIATGKKIENLGKELASVEELIKKNKENNVVGGDGLLQIGSTNKEYDKLIDKKAVLVKKIEEEMNVIRSSKAIYSQSNNEITKSTLNAIEQEVKNRNLQTEADKIAAQQKKKSDDEASKALKEKEEAYKKYVDGIRKQYAELQKVGELEVLKTQEGTDARIVAEDRAYFAQLDFMEKHKQALELTENDIAIFKQKHYNEDREREKKAYEESIKLSEKEAEEKKRLLNEQVKNEKAAILANIDALKIKKERALETGSKAEIVAATKALYDAQLAELRRASDEEYYLLIEKYQKGELAADTYGKAVLALMEKYEAEKRKLDKSTLEADQKFWDERKKKATAEATQIVNGVASVASAIVGLFSEIEKGEQQKRDEELNKLNEQLDKKLDLIESKREEDLAKSQEYYDQQIEMNKASLDAQLENTNLTEEEKKKLQETANATEKQLKIEAANEALKIKYEADQAEYEANLAKYEQEEKLKEEAFENAKKLQIAQVIINTITGAIAAFQSLAAIPYVGTILGAVAAAAVAAMGATAVANISSTKYQKGQAPKAPKPPRYQVGGGASGGSSAATSTPTPKDTTLFGTGGGSTGSQAQQPRQQVEVSGPVRAYVLAGDIQSSLEAEAALKKKVTGF